jgi:type IV pilus assembly protein PilB
MPPLSPFSSGSSGHKRSNLGEVLVEVGVISPEQFHQALTSASGAENDIAKWLIDLGFTTEEKIMKGIGIKAKVPYFTSLEGLYTAESSNIISEELARRLQVVPLFRIDNVVTVAMVNPLDVYTIDALSKTTGYRIDPVVCMRSTIFETINKLYGGWEGSQIISETPIQMPMEKSIEIPTASQKSGTIAVTNGTETLYIDAADEADAAKDGYRRVE